MNKAGGSDSTIIIAPTKSVLVYALHSLEYVLGLAQFRVFVPNIYNELAAQLMSTSQTFKTLRRSAPQDLII